MSRTPLIAAVVAALAIVVGFGAWQAQTTEAQGPPEFALPANAVQVAPDVFFLGTAVHDGRLVEGIAIAEHKPKHRPPGNEDPPDDPTPPTGGVTSCYSFIVDGSTNWSDAEPWLFNPAGAGVPVTVGDLDTGLSAWDNAVTADIFGTGTQTTAFLSADTSRPDGSNEAYFARLVGRGAGGTIAFTILWYEVGGDLVEWDMVFNTKFDWSLTGESDKMDFVNIAAHEAGHAAGMGHTEKTDLCSEQTMFPTASKGETIKRDLHDGDIAGINELY